MTYDRRILVHTLVYHQRADSRECICGWSVLGASHAEHVADVYERALAELAPTAAEDAAEEIRDAAHEATLDSRRAVLEQGVRDAADAECVPHPAEDA